MSLIYLVLFLVQVKISTHNFKLHCKSKTFTSQEVVVWLGEVIFLYNICQYVSLEFKSKLKALLKLSKKYEVELPNMKLVASPGWKFC